MPEEIAQVPSCKSRVKRNQCKWGEKILSAKDFQKTSTKKTHLSCWLVKRMEIRSSFSQTLNPCWVYFSLKHKLPKGSPSLSMRCSVSSNVFYWGQMLLKQCLSTILPFVLSFFFFFFSSRIEVVIFGTRFQLQLVAHFSFLWNGQGCPSSLHLRIWIKEKDYSGRSSRSL